MLKTTHANLMCTQVTVTAIQFKEIWNFTNDYLSKCLQQIVSEKDELQPNSFTFYII